MSKFNSGDLVQLKSGGPSMTLEEYELHGPACSHGETPYTATGRVVCKWFDENKELHTEAFLESILEKVDNCQRI